MFKTCVRYFQVLTLHFILIYFNCLLAQINATLAIIYCYCMPCIFRKFFFFYTHSALLVSNDSKEQITRLNGTAMIWSKFKFEIFQPS